MTAPVPFLPPNTKPSALIFIDGVVYTTTSGGCGAAPNAVWAMDLTAGNKVISWKTGGPDVVGSTAVAFTGDGTLYVALGKAHPGAREITYANAVVALDRTTLQPKGWFSAGDVEFSTAPIVFRYKDRDLVAVAGNDGRLYLLDGAQLGGADHKTAMHVTAKFAAAGSGAGLATWEGQGTRWILAPVTGALQAGVKFMTNGVTPSGSVAAFKVTDEANQVGLVPGWASRNLNAPLAPIVVNGLVFAVSSGEYRGTSASLTAAQRAQRSTPAVLYALDGATGRQLWSSRTTITSFARGGLSAAAGQVYLVTYDNHLYAFGIPMEH
jgi:outer membrane protein assembly factor BamB